MRPDQFTMWLRGSLDAVGEGKPIPADVAQVIYAKLTEVVAQQVANRLAEKEDADAFELRQAELQLQQQKIQYDYEIALRKLQAPQSTWTSAGSLTF